MSEFYGVEKSCLDNVDVDKLIKVLIQHGFIYDSVNRNLGPLRMRDDCYEYKKRYGDSCVIRMQVHLGKFHSDGWTGVQAYPHVQIEDLKNLEEACHEVEEIFKSDIYK